MDQRVENIIQGLKLRGFDDDAAVLEEVYGSTLAAEKERFWTALKDKTTCRCCERFAKYYPRKLSAAHIYGLAVLYRLDLEEPGYHHISEICKGKYGSVSCDFSKVEYWNLAHRKKNEKETEQDQSKNNTGLWKITDLGKLFILGHVGVMSPKITYNHKVYKTGGNLIFAKDCINEKFDYREIMQPVGLI